MWDLEIRKTLGVSRTENTRLFAVLDLVKAGVAEMMENYWVLPCVRQGRCVGPERQGREENEWWTKDVLR